jgi:hypothetical protein
LLWGAYGAASAAAAGVMVGVLAQAATRWLLERELGRHAAAVAALVARSSTYAVMAEDADMLRALADQALAADPRVDRVTIENAAGTVLATSVRPGAGPAPPRPQPKWFPSDPSTVSARAPIPATDDGRSLGAATVVLSPLASLVIVGMLPLAAGAVTFVMAALAFVTGVLLAGRWAPSARC